MKSQSSVLNEDAMAEDIIKLQLRKPKHWQWELTTSKSSPNIAFPLIQLLNRKGSLLASVKDNGNARQCFKSSDVDSNNNRQLRKCKSDMKHNFGKVLERGEKTTSCKVTAAEGKRKNALRKSKSDVLNGNASFRSNFRFRPIAEEPKTPPGPAHKRTNSDEMYDYFLKRHKDASLKRAISDGYSNFLAASPSGDQFPVYRYTYRSSNAGTLLIGEEVQEKPAAKKWRSRKDGDEGTKRRYNKRNLSEPLRYRNSSSNVPTAEDDVYAGKSFPECGYTVQEPITGSSDGRKSSAAFTPTPAVAAAATAAERCSEIAISKRRKHNRRRRSARASPSVSSDDDDDDAAVDEERIRHRRRKLNKGKGLYD